MISSGCFLAFKDSKSRSLRPFYPFGPAPLKSVQNVRIGFSHSRVKGRLTDTQGRRDPALSHSQPREPSHLLRIKLDTFRPARVGLRVGGGVFEE